MRIRLVLLMCCLLTARVAQGQEAGQDPRVSEAKAACVAGDVQKGVRLLADLYMASSDPIWIFNQGRCYHQNARPVAQAYAQDATARGMCPIWWDDGNTSSGFGLLNRKTMPLVWTWPTIANALKTGATLGSATGVDAIGP